MTGERAEVIGGARRSRLLRILRIALQVVVGTICFVLVATAAFLVYLTTDAGKERARALVEARLRKQLPGEVQLGALDYELFGAVRLKGLRIRGLGRIDTLVVDELEGSADWLELLTDDAIALDDLSMRGVLIDLRGSAEPSKPKKPPEREPAHEAAPERHIELRHVAMTDIEIRTRAPGSRSVALHRVDGRLGLAGSRIAIEHLDLDGDGWRATLTGSYDRETTAFELEASADGARVSDVLSLAGVGTPRSIDALVTGRLRGTGTLEAPVVAGTVLVTTVRADGGDRAAADIRGRLTPDSLGLDIVVRDADRRDDVILRWHGSIPIVVVGAGPRIDPIRPLEVRITVPERAVRDLTKYVPPSVAERARIPRHGSIEADLRLTGSIYRPAATARVRAEASLLEPTQPRPLQTLDLDASLRPKQMGLGFDADASVLLEAEPGGDHLVRGTVSATFPRSPLGRGLDGVEYEGAFDLGPGSLRSLPDVGPLARVRRWGGRADGKLSFRGTREDLFAKLHLEADHLGSIERHLPSAIPSGAVTELLPPGPARGLYDAVVDVEIGEHASTLVVDAQLEDERLAKLEGIVGIAGKGFFRQIRRGADPSIDLTLVVPSRPLDTLSSIRSSFEDLPGVLSGYFRVRGTVMRPVGSGALHVTDVEMADGSDGGAGLSVRIDDDGFVAVLGVGESDAVVSPLQLAARTSRGDAVRWLRSDSNVSLRVGVAATHVDLRRIIPQEIVEDRDGDVSGVLDGRLRFDVDLARRAGMTTVVRGSTAGTISLAGTVPIPGMKRLCDGLRLRLSAQRAGALLEGWVATSRAAKGRERGRRQTSSFAFDDLGKARRYLALDSTKWLCRSRITRPAAST